MLRVLSLGAGVQSTTLALLAAVGEIGPPLDCAIFADTGSEPAGVYRHLEWLCSGVLPFPVHVLPPVKGRSLGAELLASTRGESPRGSHARPPFYVKKIDGEKGIIRRQCTGDYKIDPIEKRIRELLGIKPRARWPREAVVEQWLGISRDEASRMKQAPRSAMIFRYPLIEIGWTRHNCLEWLARRGYPTPPKSACTFCPYHTDRTWRELRDTDPGGWQEAIEIDEAIRQGLQQTTLAGELYLHKSCIPLRLVDLSSAEDRGQLNWLNECGGHCGV